MSTVDGTSPMTMASLYGMLGLAMPSGTSTSSSGATSTIQEAMLSVANTTTSAEVGALLAGVSGSATASQGAADLTAALMSLVSLDPALELQRLEAAGSLTTADAATAG
jgi:hypothetical protein